MAEVHDLVVVGDGVAAQAALLTLGAVAAAGEPGLRVALVAPTRRPRTVPLGEHLSAAAVPALEALELDPRALGADHLEVQSAFSAWGTPLLAERHAMQDPRGGGWCLDRPRFDEVLRHESERRLLHDRIDDTVLGVDEGAGELRLVLREGSELAARTVLDASGRTAAVARRGAPRERLDRLVALVAAYEATDPGIDATAGPLVEARPQGWLYSALLPDRRLVVAWFTDADLLPRPSSSQGTGDHRAAVLAEELRAGLYTRQRLETAGYDAEHPPAVARAADASSLLASAVTGDRWTATGDAAAAFDPLASHGLTVALWSGRQAALALIERLRGETRGLERYEATWRRATTSYRADRARYYEAERRFATAFWRRRWGVSAR